MFNNLVCYLCLSCNYLGSHIGSLFSPNSVGCLALGYLTLYTFTALMFWINAMAANIFFKFSSILSSSSTDQGRAKFLLYGLYAQVSGNKNSTFIENTFLLCRLIDS